MPLVVAGFVSNTDRAQKLIATDVVGRAAVQGPGTIVGMDDGKRDEVEPSQSIATLSASREDLEPSRLSTNDTDLEGQMGGLQLKDASGPGDFEPQDRGKRRALGNEIFTGEMQKKVTKPELIVKQRHFRIVSLLFPSERGDRGTVLAWTDSTSLMAELRFTIQFRGGSSYNFKAKCGSINVHRPHPGNEISPSKMRDHGRRLSARFNWHREMSGLAA